MKHTLNPTSKKVAEVGIWIELILLWLISAVAILRGVQLPKFSIYPNPTSRLVTIDFESDKDNKVSVELLDVYGKVILKNKFTSTSGQNQFPLDVSKVNSGIYFLKMTNGQTISIQKLEVVKQ